MCTYPESELNIVTGWYSFSDDSDNKTKILLFSFVEFKIELNYKKVSLKLAPTLE